jgi:DNA-directed RNA polymerase subunit M/transcription elongation factor TFIIS
MPEIEFSCPECGQVLEAPEEMAGETIECPSCEAEIAIPQPAAPDTLVLPNLPNIEITSPAAAAPAQNACPECGNELAPAAVFCVNCGFHLKLGKKMSTEFD